MWQVIEGVGAYYASIRNAKRARALAEETARVAAIETAQAERQAMIDSARALIPPAAYDVALVDAGISARVLGHLQKADVENIGQVMERLAEGDEGMLRLDGIGPKSLTEIKGAIEKLDLPEVVPEPVEEAVAAELEEEAVAEEPAVEAEPAVGEEVAAEPAEAVEEPLVPEAEIKEPVAVEPDEVPADLEPQIEGGPEIDAGEKRKRDKTKRREVVFDEELGVMVTRRLRKRAGASDDWDELRE